MAQTKKMTKTSKVLKLTNAKLTAKDVLSIRKTYKAKKATQAELAKQYGVSVSAVAQLLGGRTWSHV